MTNTISIAPFVPSSLSPYENVLSQEDPWPGVRDAVAALNEQSHKVFDEWVWLWHCGRPDGSVEIGNGLISAEHAVNILHELMFETPLICAEARKWGWMVVGVAEALHEINRQFSTDIVGADAEHVLLWEPVKVLLKAMWAEELHSAVAPELVDGDRDAMLSGDWCAKWRYAS